MTEVKRTRKYYDNCDLVFHNVQQALAERKCSIISTDPHSKSVVAKTNWSLTRDRIELSIHISPAGDGSTVTVSGYRWGFDVIGMIKRHIGEAIDNYFMSLDGYCETVSCEGTGKRLILPEDLYEKMSKIRMLNENTILNKEEYDREVVKIAESLTSENTDSTLELDYFTTLANMKKELSVTESEIMLLKNAIQAAMNESNG
jgi:hypothetical protein